MTDCSNSDLAAAHRSEFNCRPDRDGWNGATDIL
jgi:hypothetical protein